MRIGFGVKMSAKNGNGGGNGKKKPTAAVHLIGIVTTASEAYVNDIDNYGQPEEEQVSAKL